MPLLDLCNRLVVTSIRRNTPLPSFRLSPFRPPRPAPRFRSNLRPSFHTSLSTTTPNSRCRHLRPWVVTQLVPRRQPLPASPPRRVARCPEPEPVRTLSALHAPDALAHEHLLSHPLSSLGSPSSVPGCHALLPCRPPRLHTIHRPEAPSAGRSHRLCSALALGTRLPGRHWYPDFAAMGPASDMLSRPASPNARLKSRAGFHRST